ncbi:uncharacterized protein VTP21DRAFT_10598 [Calcarisporiella thermophila]|uniref:uncharacterized protein n=1 Tax=Calcarisporiella thermophila TaxID=911321 RepID=UPI003742A908
MRSIGLVSLALIALLCGSSSAASSTPHKLDHKNRHYYSVEITEDTHPTIIARRLGAVWEGPIGELTRHHLFSIPKRDSERHLLARRDATEGILSMSKQVPRLRHKRGPIPNLDVNDKECVQLEKRAPEQVLTSSKIAKQLKILDPGFFQQWHLYNEHEPGNDINVTGVWRQGNYGENVVVAIVDDGLDMESDDLKENFFAPGSYDFNDHTDLPKPRLPDDYHGTRCAGEIAAQKNIVCGIGIAPSAKVAGIRILSAKITDADEAAALNYGYQYNHIYSCSWGPPDNGKAVEAPEGVVHQALVNGVEKGRGGKGSIFVFASGNGGIYDDNCNFDGYTNSRYTITIGAIDHMNNYPAYSEKCSAMLAVTYSSGSGNYIFTTDVGKNTCAQRHGGTSAAAPLAAGIFALVLSVRPDLTWRDMQHLVVQTAEPISLDEEDWEKTASGRMFNHKFGYGRLDTYRIVEAAKTFKSVGPATVIKLPVIKVDMTIPQNDVGMTSSAIVLLDNVKSAKLGRLEHVTVTINMEHEYRGDVEIFLVSPAGVTSELAAHRRFDDSTEGLKNWTFMTVKHWDENPIGSWTLKVVDQFNPDKGGKLLDWQISFHGERNEKAGEGVDSGGPKIPVPSVHSPAATKGKPAAAKPAPPPTPKPPTTTFSAPAPKETTPSTSSSPSSIVEPSSPNAQPTSANPAVEEGNEPVTPQDGAIFDIRTIMYIVAGALITGVLAAFAYFGRKWWSDRKQRDNYEFSVLNGSEDDESRQPLRDVKEEENQELYDAFGESDEEMEDEEEVWRRRLKKRRTTCDNVHIGIYILFLP